MTARATLRAALALAGLALGACRTAPRGGEAPRAASWFRGNTHTHTLWSDGDDFPEMVAEWYREQGYHFLGISDHNVYQRGPRWMAMREINTRSGNVALQKYLDRFGDTWVETRGTSEGGGPLEVRLKPLDEYDAKVLRARRRGLVYPYELAGLLTGPDGTLVEHDLDDTGALVLSEFAGAAAELKQAYQVNPYDINGMKATLLEAAQAPQRELARRMRAMRRVVTDHDIARKILDAIPNSARAPPAAESSVVYGRAFA